MQDRSNNNNFNQANDSEDHSLSTEENILLDDINSLPFLNVTSYDILNENRLIVPNTFQNENDINHLQNNQFTNNEVSYIDQPYSNNDVQIQKKYIPNLREKIQKCKKQKDVVRYAQSQDPFLKRDTLSVRLTGWFSKNYPTDQRSWFDQLKELANNEDDTQLQQCWQTCVIEKIKSINNISNQRKYSSNLQEEIQKCETPKDVLLYAQSQDPFLKDNDVLSTRLREWFEVNYPTDQRHWFDQLKDLANTEGDTQHQQCWQKCVTKKIKSINNISNQRIYSSNPQEEIQKCKRPKDVVLYAQFLDPFLNIDNLSARLRRWFKKNIPTDPRPWYFKLKALADQKNNTQFQQCWKECVTDRIKNKNISNQDKKKSSEVDCISREENISTVYNTQDPNILNSKNISEQHFYQEEYDPFYFQQYSNQYNGINEYNYYQYYINNVYNFNVFDNEGGSYQVNGKEIKNPVPNFLPTSEERKNYSYVDGSEIQKFTSFNNEKKKKRKLMDDDISFSKKRKKNTKEKVYNQEQYMLDSNLSSFDNKQQNNQNQENIEIDSYNNRQNYFNVIDNSSNNEMRKSVYESRVPLFNTSSFSPNQDNLIEEKIFLNQYLKSFMDKNK